MRLMRMMRRRVMGLVPVLRMLVIIPGGCMMLIAQLVMHRARAHTKPHPETVIRSQQRRENEHSAEPVVAAGDGLRDDFILGKESARNERNPGKAHAAVEHRVARDAPAAHMTKARELAKIELTCKAV